MKTENCWFRRLNVENQKRCVLRSLRKTIFCQTDLFHDFRREVLRHLKLNKIKNCRTFNLLHHLVVAVFKKKDSPKVSCCQDSWYMCILKILPKFSRTNVAKICVTLRSLKYQSNTFLTPPFFTLCIFSFVLALVSTYAPLCCFANCRKRLIRQAIKWIWIMYTSFSVLEYFANRPTLFLKQVASYVDCE